MDKFAYKGTDRRGEIHSGILEAINEEEARLALASRGLKIVDIKPLDATLTSGRLKLSALPLPPPPTVEAPEARSRLFREKTRSPEPLSPPLPPPPPPSPPRPTPERLSPPPLPLEPPPPLPPPPPLGPPPAVPGPSLLSRRSSQEGPPPAPPPPPGRSASVPADPGPVMPASPNPRLSGEEPTVILPPLTPEQRAELLGEPAAVAAEEPPKVTPPLPPPTATPPPPSAAAPPARVQPSAPPPASAPTPTEAPTRPKTSAAQAALAEIDFAPPRSRRETRKMEVHAAPASRARPGPRKIPRVSAGAFRPRAWQEWLEALTIPRRFLNMIWGTLAVLGMLVMIGQAFSSHGAPKDKQPGQLAYHDVRLKIRGSAGLADSSSVTGVKVTLHLPEIPLDLQEELAKVKTTDRGDFVYETSFSSQKVPTYCIISASCKGYDSKDTKELPLAGDPLAAEAPPLLLTPARPQRKY